MARVLIVLDGAFRFSIGTTTDPDFTYTALVDALTNTGHTVTKAHRNTVTSLGGIDTSPDVITDYHFHTSNLLNDPGNLLNYDVIWLIGWEGRNSPTSTGDSPAGIGDAEIAAIARFMAAGGGVFATGDHDGIGNVMCGRIPRVRAMRSWFGANDNALNKPAGLPDNFPSLTVERADTTQVNMSGHYDDPAPPPEYVWFENQSDSIPQTITPTPSSPAHPILRRGGADITVYPDHMHEGNTLGRWMGYDYGQTLTFAGESFVEFPPVPASPEVLHVIAQGHTVQRASRYVATGGFVGGMIGGVLHDEVSAAKTVNTLSVYDGRAAGVGRIVTGSTFHHYVDINLTGTSVVNTDDLSTKVGPNARKNHGLSDDHDKFDQIKTVFNNITNWLARPRPRIQIILERSTFSQAEAMASPDFADAILVIVDGLKPNQFPGGPITTLSPSMAQLQSWAPTITPMEPAGLAFFPTRVNSDDPMPLSDRLQRFTFTYRVQVTGAFGFSEDFNHVRVDAALTSAAVSGTLTDSAQITLVKSANPFMLDLEAPNTAAWLSSDVKVFPIVAGAPGSGLGNEASREDAIAFLRARLLTMTDAQFTGLSGNEEASALSPYARTTMSHRRVYNFAVARVRMPASGASADQVRVFFRIVPSPTTAALTYNESMGVPVGSYKETSGAIPIAIPGTDAAVTDWWSFPCFLHGRISPPEMQIDGDNLKDHLMPGSSTFFGALLDNNLDEDPYLTASPVSGGMPLSLPMLMMGEHQCIVAQIKYGGTPIPDGANPFTSDKLSQRNLAFSEIANPGLDASRTALHTFEIEATPNPVSDALPPDELLLDWRGAAPPDGTEVRLFVPGWNAEQVVEMADRFYPRHEIRAVEAHTVALPGGGVRYVPIPSSATRQTGIVIADFPLGVKKGQRFDLAVRQVTTRGRQVTVLPKVTEISTAEAARLIQGLTVPANQPGDAPQAGDAPPRGVFDLGGNRTLVTDLSVFDAAGDHALIIEHPDAVKVEAARNESGRWRETIGAFQLGIPVSVRADMLAHHLRLLSVLRWRAERLRPNDRWYATFVRYVELIAEKVRALGGDPFSVPATPGGIIPLPGKNEDPVGCLGWLVCLFRTCIRLLTGGHQRA